MLRTNVRAFAGAPAVTICFLVAGGPTASAIQRYAPPAWNETTGQDVYYSAFDTAVGDRLIGDDEDFAGIGHPNYGPWWRSCVADESLPCRDIPGATDWRYTPTKDDV